MKQQQNTAPLVRRQISDPKRPWLDWRSSELSITKTKSVSEDILRPPKQLGTAYFWFFFSGGLGSHRHYLEYENTHAFTLKFMALFVVYIAALILIGSFDIEGQGWLLWLATIIFFAVSGYLAIQEYRTIEPAYEAYEKKFYEKHSHIPPRPHHRRQ